MFKNEYISLELVSARLNLPEGYLKELVKKGKIPYLAVGKRKRFKEQAVRAALEKIEQAAIAQRQKQPKQQSFLTGNLR